MKKTLYDESNGLWYELRGDYYIPCLKVLERVHTNRQYSIDVR